MILNFVFFILTPLAVKTLVTVKTDNSRMTTELQMINDRIQSFENAMKDITTRQQKTAKGIDNWKKYFLRNNIPSTKAKKRIIIVGSKLFLSRKFHRFSLTETETDTEGYEAALLTEIS